MAQEHSLKDVLHRVIAALSDYARARALPPGGLRVYARFSPKWGKVHVLVVSDSFNGRDGSETYAEVRRDLEDRLRDDPALLHAVGLIIRSGEQVRCGGVHAIGPEYREVELESADVSP